MSLFSMTLPPHLRGLAAVFLLLPSLATAQTLIAIGGALRFDNAPVWQRIVDEAGGPGARFVVLATAAGNPERSARQIIEALAAQGARAEFIPVAPRLQTAELQRELRNPDNLAKVEAARGVFFSGGAQGLIVDSLQPGGRPTELLRAIWRLYERGGVIAGTSAGAAVMSTTMFRDAPDNLQVLKGRLREGRELDRGLGFAGPELFIDQHFLRRGRIGRMLPLMLAKGYKLGLGVEENSAAVIKAGRLEIIGARGALLVDLSRARHDERLGAFNLSGALLSYLDRGDRHDLRSGRSEPAPHKTAAHATDTAAPDFEPSFEQVPFYADMLGDNTIVQAMGRLLDSPQPQLRGLAFAPPAGVEDERPELGFEFRLYKTPETRGWTTGSAGSENCCTLLRLGLDVLPVRLARPLYAPLSAPIVSPAASASAAR